jgi:hypothetical protein
VDRHALLPSERASLGEESTTAGGRRAGQDELHAAREAWLVRRIFEFSVFGRTVRLLCRYRRSAWDTPRAVPTLDFWVFLNSWRGFHVH